MYATVLRTERDADDRRVIDDDLERWEIIFRLARHVIEETRPTLCVLEAYAPRKGTSGWKSLPVFGAIAAACWERDIPVKAVWPQDLKRRFSPDDSDKEAIQLAMEEYVSGFTKRLVEIPTNQREHVCDAAACACLGLEM